MPRSCINLHQIIGKEGRYYMDEQAWKFPRKTKKRDSYMNEWEQQTPTVLVRILKKLQIAKKILWKLQGTNTTKSN